jgi:hypothetical protein
MDQGRIYPLPRIVEADEGIEGLRVEIAEGFARVHARLDRVEERGAAQLDLAVEAIKTANASSTKKTAAWVTITVAIVTALGTVLASYFRG